MTEQDIWKQTVGQAAAQFVEQDMLVGLGTGSTARAFIQALGQRVQQGLRVKGAIASSQVSQDLAASLGIPITDFATHPTLDLYVDGTDEIDPQLMLLKGAGGALLREKVVATASRRFIVIADESKQVLKLGTRFPIPVEIVPFALVPAGKHLEALGATMTVRQRDGKPFLTENSNLILDCAFPHPLDDPFDIDDKMHSIVGVVETGLFLNIAAQAIIAGPDGLTFMP